MRHTASRRIALPAALIALLAGCSGDDATGPTETTVADLAGLWQASAFSQTSDADPSVGADLIAMGGNMNWSVQTTGSFTGTAVLPGALVGTGGTITLPLSGVIRLVDANTLRIDFVPEIPPLFTFLNAAFTLSGNTLTVIDSRSSFDFDGDGQKEGASVRAVFVRN